MKTDKAKNQTKYFQPDSRWSFQETSLTPNQFVENHVIRGYFHSNVPDEILKSYETAAHLMAYSYFHWPLYDEALKKILGIFEMTIKLKAQEFGIRTKTEKAPVSISVLIDQLIKKGFPSNRKNTLDWIRKVRNYYSHPERHSFTGGTAKNFIIPILNTINELYYSYTQLIENQNKLLQLNQNIDSFEETCFILEMSQSKYLIHRIEPLCAFKSGESFVYILGFYPILENPKRELKNHSVPVPFTIAIADLNVGTNSIKGIDVAERDSIEVYLSENNKDLARFREYIETYQQLNEMDRMAIDSFQEGTISNRKHDLIYRFGWQ